MRKILRSRCETILPNVSKFVIFMCVLIKCCVYFDKYLSGVVKCVQFWSKVNFITNIINSTRIHTFYFYNNKHTFINTDTTFTTKHTNFIKINKSLVVGPKCSPLYELVGAMAPPTPFPIQGYQVFFLIKKKKGLAGAVIIPTHLNPNLTQCGTHLSNNGAYHYSNSQLPDSQV